MRIVVLLPDIRNCIRSPGGPHILLTLNSKSAAHNSLYKSHATISHTVEVLQNMQTRRHVLKLTLSHPNVP